MSTPFDLYYLDYDSEFALLVDECRRDNRSLQCSATHAVIAEEYIAIQDAAMLDALGKPGKNDAELGVWLSAKRWGVAHSLYAALLAREGL